MSIQAMRSTVGSCLRKRVLSRIGTVAPEGKIAREQWKENRHFVMPGKQHFIVDINGRVTCGKEVMPFSEMSKLFEGMGLLTLAEASSQNSSEDGLLKLVKGNQPEAMVAVENLRKRKCNEAIIMAAAIESNSLWIREMAAKSPSVPTEALLRCLDNESENYCHGKYNSMSYPPGYERLAYNNLESRFHNNEFSEEQLRISAESKNNGVRKLIAESPNTPERYLITLTGDDDHVIVQAAFGALGEERLLENYEEVLKKLKNGVKIKLAESKSTPVVFLVGFLSDPNYEIASKAGTTLKHAGYDRNEIGRILAKNPNTKARIQAIKSYDLSHNILVTLLKDENDGVVKLALRRLIEERGNLPTDDRLIRILSEVEEEVRKEIEHRNMLERVTSDRTPAMEILEIVEKSNDCDVYTEGIRNVMGRIEYMENKDIEKDTDENIMGNEIREIEGLSGILRMASTSKHFQLRFLAASSNSTPIHSLVELVQDEDVYIAVEALHSLLKRS